MEINEFVNSLPEDILKSDDFKSFVKDYNYRNKQGCWIQYVNGNYIVEINTINGTSIRTLPFDFMDAEFPENIDIMVSKRCAMGCPMCHEGCTTDGAEADILKFVTDKESFLYSLRPGTELAIGLNEPMHKNIEDLLKLCKERKILANITVHQTTLLKNMEKIEQWLKDGYVHGIGVSYWAENEDVIKFAQKHPTTVFHTINGITTPELYQSLFDKNLKVLILGYKEFRRGVEYKEQQSLTISKNQLWLYDNLEDFTKKFKVTSFDNLALAQLNPKRFLTDDQWATFYRGKDSTGTMYIDLVEEVFASHSTAPINKRYDIKKDIKDMFQRIKNTVEESI